MVATALEPKKKRSKRLGKIIPTAEDLIPRTLRLPQSLWQEVEKQARAANQPINTAIIYLLKYAVTEDKAIPQAEPKGKR